MSPELTISEIFNQRENFRSSENYKEAKELLASLLEIGGAGIIPEEIAEKLSKIETREQREKMLKRIIEIYISQSDFEKLFPDK